MRNCVGEIATATNFRSKIRVVIRTFHIFSFNIAKVYYVNQLSAGRVVRAMRCCHEMRVRVGRRHCCPVRARIFLVTICFLYVSRMSHVRKYSPPLERIRAMVNRSRARFLVSLICSRVHGVLLITMQPSWTSPLCHQLTRVHFEIIRGLG